MNVTELARRLRVSPEELYSKLPELGFSIGRKAIKIDNRVAQQIQEAWAEMRRKARLNAKMEAQKQRSVRAEPTGEKGTVSLPPIVTVRDLATTLNVPVPRLMQELMQNGILASINERIDFDTATILAEDLGFKVTPQEASADDLPEGHQEAEDRLRQTLEKESKEEKQARPPVIVIMGHVDHGKTKLLDAIRTTNVVDSEAGGITQHIGAYQTVRSDRTLTFIDTPGHEAFTVMRSRGAKVADIAILVVAADDGVQPQTKEAINIIQSAHLPFVVALNKIDRAEANVDRVKTQLSDLGLVPEEWGGKTIVVPISAREGTNIGQLLDMVLLVADLDPERIATNPDRNAIATVIESRVDPEAGLSATVLVQAGTLKVGDTLGIRGVAMGRVRAMRDWKGESVEVAPPSTPVRVLGWKVAPTIGDITEVPEDPRSLTKLKATETSRQATEEVAALKHVLRPEVGAEASDANARELRLIVRSDVLGSLEAILGMLDTIRHEEVSVKVIGRGLGNVTERDVLNAEASQASIFGFNVEATAGAIDLAREKQVEFKKYAVIYKLFEDVIAKLQTLLPVEVIYNDIGKLEVKLLFRKSDDGWILGGTVLEGKLTPKVKLRLKRGEEYVGEGELVALRSGRSEVPEMRAGQECGLQYKGRTKPEVGDIIEAYTREERRRNLKIAGVRAR